MTVIELGEISSSSPEYEPPFRSPSTVRLIAVAVVVGCLLGVTGSVRPAASGPPELWSVPNLTDQFQVTDSAIYLISNTTDTTLTSHDPRTGRVRWKQALPSPLAGWFATDTEGIVLVPSGDLQPAGDLRNIRTRALDADTGELVWEQPGEVMNSLPGSVLLGRWEPGVDGVLDLRLVRATDGTTMWALTEPETVKSWTTIGPDEQPPTRMVLVTGDGHTEVRRFSDGAVIATGTVPWIDPDHDEQVYSSVFGAGNILFVSRSEDGREELFAYDVNTLTRLWNARADAGYSAGGCGPVLCLHVGPNRVDGLDPHTGERVWQSSGFDGAWPIGNGRLVGSDGINNRTSLVDAATGRVLSDLGTDSQTLPAGSGNLLVVSATKEAQPRTKLSVLGRDDALHVRAVLSGSGQRPCQLTGTLLACGTAPGSLNVYDVSDLIGAGQ